MLGISVYLYDRPNRSFIENMHRNGFNEVFTSLHIPEYSFTDTWENMQQLGMICSENGMELTVDLSQKMVKELPVSLEKLKTFGITGLRLDDGFTMQQASSLSLVYKVALNASTLTATDLQQLHENGAKLSQIEAWHNYYPRIYTGLDEDFFLAQNKMFQVANIKVAAFVMGDEQLRAPMFEGLPTLEMHRNKAVLANTLELLKDYAVNTVFIGDPIISEFAQRQFAHYFMHDTLLLPVIMAHEFNPLFERLYHNRPEIARDVVRLVESRGLFADNNFSGEGEVRNSGDVTINMQALSRYAGEVQLVKRPLPRDPDVLTLGCIERNSIALLKHCKGLQNIQLEEFADGFRKINN
ncbi:MAG: DUF871 domain-containing protein [Kurthia sp.]|nr:DUF871 domain-containing protein [Candidatus Kurthia equi]